MESVILTNMCMIQNEVGEVVVQLRTKKDWPGLSFPGGHIEQGESFVASVIREVREETGLIIKHPTLCGIKQFPIKNGGRYIVLFFKASQFEGELVSSDEGEVFWLHPSAFSSYEIANDFMGMLEVFQSDNLSEFFYEQTLEEIWQYHLY